MSIDWSKAPERATHYTARRPAHFACWWRITESDRPEVWVIDDEDGSLDHRTSVVLSNENRDLLIPRPVQWDGQGLPPVGVTCEYRRARDAWSPVIVFAHRSNTNGSITALFDYTEVAEWGACAEPTCFRPTLTPEQIAAMERDKATTEWLNQVAKDYDQHTAAKLEHILVGAGYRKVEGDKR